MADDEQNVIKCLLVAVAINAGGYFGKKNLNRKTALKRGGVEEGGTHTHARTHKIIS